MRVLLLSGGSYASSQAMLEVTQELVERGLEVHLAMAAAPSTALRETATTLVVWGNPKAQAQEAPTVRFAGPVDATDSSAADAEVQPLPPARRPPSPRRQRLEKQSLRVWNRLKRVGQSSRTWRRVRRDSALLARASEADVIVAVDTQAVLASWKLGRRYASPDVVYGLSAGRGVITRRLSASTP